MDKHVNKEYSNGEITVLWQSEKCIHSGNCVQQLKAVFNPNQRPWIQMDKAEIYQRCGVEMSKRCFEHQVIT